MKFDEKIVIKNEIHEKAVAFKTNDLQLEKDTLLKSDG